MHAILFTPVHAQSTRSTHDEVIQRDWQRHLDAANTPQERDEINDVFGKATAD